MTQQAVEQALGKLLTDEAFRERFFAAPDEACRQAGLTVSSVEVEALARLSREQLDQLGGALDGRISRPSLDPTCRHQTNRVEGQHSRRNR
jgi:Ribosomally synthesized peptide prototyped by Frankia Franean1_4349.